MKLGWIILIFVAASASAQQILDESDSIQLEYELEALRVNYTDSASNLIRYSLAKKSQTDSIYSPYFKAKLYNNLGWFYARLNKLDSALMYLDSASNLRLTHGYLDHYATSQENIANVLYRKGFYKSSLDHLYKSLDIKRESNKPEYLKSLYNNLGNTHYQLDSYDSARFYYDQALVLYQIEDDTIGLAVVQNNFGNLFFQIDENENAIEAYRIAIKLYKSIGNLHGQIEPTYNIGYVYEWAENFDSAFYYYQKALMLSKSSGDGKYVDLIHLQLARTYAEIGMSDSSIAMFEKYIVYRDLQDRIENEAIVSKYETQFRTQKTEKKLLRTELTSKKRQQLNYILLSSIGIVFLIAFFLIRNYRQKKKMGELELDVKNKEIDNLLKEQEAKSYAALLEGQSAERARIAQDLHDHLGATLSAVKIQFEAMDNQIEQLKEENKKQFEKMNEMINEAVKDVRRISHDLSSGKLVEQGLRGVLNDLVEILNASNRLKVTFYMDDKISSMPLKVEKELYAVIQESMSNILKHAQAGNVDLQLNLQDDLVNVMIEDDGIGFNMDDATDKGLGLMGMENRLKKVQGEIKFDSKIGRGTIIIINIPYDSNSTD